MNFQSPSKHKSDSGTPALPGGIDTEEFPAIGEQD